MLLDEGLAGNCATQGMRWDGEHGSIGKVVHPYYEGDKVQTAGERW